MKFKIFIIIQKICFLKRIIKIFMIGEILIKSLNLKIKIIINLQFIC